MLQISGINNKFTAHSTRSASVLAAKSQRTGSKRDIECWKLVSWIYFQQVLQQGDHTGCQECWLLHSDSTLKAKRRKWVIYKKCISIHCHICSFITKWNWQSHKHLKDMMWDIWQCISHPYNIITITVTHPNLFTSPQEWSLRLCLMSFSIQTLSAFMPSGYANVIGYNYEVWQWSNWLLVFWLLVIFNFYSTVNTIIAKLGDNSVPQ